MTSDQGAVESMSDMIVANVALKIARFRNRYPERCGWANSLISDNADWL